MNDNNFNFDLESKFSINISSEDQFADYNKHHFVQALIDSTTKPSFTIDITELEKYIKTIHVHPDESRCIQQHTEMELDLHLKNIRLLEILKYKLFAPKMNWYNTVGDITFSGTICKDFTTFKIFIIDINAAFLLQNFVKQDSEKYIEQFQGMLDDSLFENMIFICCKSSYDEDDFYKYMKFFDKNNFIEILKNYNERVLNIDTWFEISCGLNVSSEDLQSIYQRIYAEN
jgi:hypothetical protein